MKVSLSGTSKYRFCNLARGLRSKRCIVEIYTLHNGRSLLAAVEVPTCDCNRPRKGFLARILEIEEDFFCPPYSV